MTGLFAKLKRILPPRRAERVMVPPASARHSSPWTPGVTEWTADNAAELAKFFTSSTGQALLVRARARQCATAIASQQAQAVGEVNIETFSDAIDWLVSLSKISGSTADQVENSGPDANGEPSADDLLSP